MDKLIDDLIKLAFAEDIGDGIIPPYVASPRQRWGKAS